mmetsp:Transcript_15181/g.26966  ORF Transcript_15181/g.26966 Transcript_15181/m.26966 type:complete len:142 (+) Transcript_15181:2-427(+)
MGRWPLHPTSLLIVLHPPCAASGAEVAKETSVLALERQPGTAVEASLKNLERSYDFAFSSGSACPVGAGTGLVLSSIWSAAESAGLSARPEMMETAHSQKKDTRATNEILHCCGTIEKVRHCAGIQNTQQVMRRSRLASCT